jgi:hypothetical protein
MGQDVNNLNTNKNDSQKLNQAPAPEVDLDQLKFFMSEFDPYAPISNEDKQFLESLQIFDTSDPFHVTNQLISIVENLIEAQENKQSK